MHFLEDNDVCLFVILPGSTFIRDREKERTSSLCILSKSILINFGKECIFVKVLRRYDENYSKQHIGLFEEHINTHKKK